MQLPSAFANCSANSDCISASKSNTVSSKSCSEISTNAYISCAGSSSKPTVYPVVSLLVPLSETHCAENCPSLLGIWMLLAPVERTLAILLIGEISVIVFNNSLTYSGGAKYPPVESLLTVNAFFSTSF